MLCGVSVVLVRPRFPENIGMCARAMANMGARELILVEPERWEREKAEPLATSQGKMVLGQARLCPSLEEALAPFAAAFGATARTGGWRKDLLSPERAAVEIRALVRGGGRAALVFGPEDRGLENAEVERCTQLVNIPTLAAHSSLNLAQAVLILLYECVKADLKLPFAEGAERTWTRPATKHESRRATIAEEGLLMRTLQETLVSIGHLPDDNPSWFMQPLRRFLRKSRLRRHEFDMLMGICRQTRNALAQAKDHPENCPKD
ncbi:RNA methyltransferase [Desulfovibrio sp. OttesenSCG-928-A18]|nr:RNA methyltransferase [Desulfovibrio sp. OttesenSCG-928-A18]